jgi:multicomponent Na+:H+ antiporter subunit E
VSPFLWNLILALVWAFATGEFSLPNLMIGFALGYVILWFVRRDIGAEGYVARVPRAVWFVVFYLWQMLLSNLRVAYDVVTPRHYMRPGVIAVPLAAETDAEVTLLANLITLTPGTLSLDLSPDGRTLYVHVMYLSEDVEETRRQIKDQLERRVLGVLR